MDLHQKRQARRRQLQQTRVTISRKAPRKTRRGPAVRQCKASFWKRLGSPSSSSSYDCGYIYTVVTDEDWLWSMIKVVRLKSNNNYEESAVFTFSYGAQPLAHTHSFTHSRKDSIAARIAARSDKNLNSAPHKSSCIRRLFIMFLDFSRTRDMDSCRSWWLTNKEISLLRFCLKITDSSSTVCPNWQLKSKGHNKRGLAWTK